MRFEIVVAPEPDRISRSEARDLEPTSVDPEGADSDPRPSRPASSAARRRPPAREVLDIFLDGANVTARVADRQAACVLRDLAGALVELSARPRGKSIVRFYDDAWELCVERFGSVAALSVYRTGSDPEVAVLDRAVPFAEVVEGARGAIAAVLARGASSTAIDLEIRALDDALSLAKLDDVDSLEPLPAPSTVIVEPDADAPVAFGAELALRLCPPGHAEPSVERADLHALLFRGRLRAEIRGRTVDLGECHPFLAAERLLSVARQTLDAWERGQPLYQRSEAGRILVGVRLSADGGLALSLRAARPAASTLSPSLSLHTFPALGVVDVVESALAFGRALSRAILRRDRSQAGNLRLSAFRRSLRETGDALREACRRDAKTNPTPEPYRAFAIARAVSRADEAPMPAGTKLRYSSRWRALVPGIDLRATFLCGDRLVVGAAAETFCLDRATGEVLWRVETQRATSVVTPGGLARIHPDGLLAVHDFGSGEVVLRTWLAPRTGGPASGAVVHMQGLPRLLVVTEGERHLVAIDLMSGEPRWRHAWGGASAPKGGSRGPSGVPRLKRAGKLLYFTSGDSALTALDVLSGAVVWRVRDRLRFRVSPALHHDTLFALAGGASSAAQLHAIDAFSGDVRWSRRVRPLSTGGGAPCTVEGAALVAGDVVALPVRDREGLVIVAHDRETGEPRWESAPRIAPGGTAWIAVDDLFIGNTPTGEVVAVEAATGALRYRHLLGRGLEHDVPRRLEPILRSGALFVPHTDVRVLRPRDGAVIGAVSPSDAIPDLLRVDERCDVYIAEESGHLVSFGAGARLTLVHG